MTSIQSRQMQGLPTDVWTVLADGWLYGLWVVGASCIRTVDATWPDPGSCIHHSVGSWPVILNDTTTVMSSVPGHELELQARAWPSGEAAIHLTIEPEGDGCVVTMSEDASRGPGLLVPEPIRRVALDWRNGESLRRLTYLVEGRGRRNREAGS